MKVYTVYQSTVLMEISNILLICVIAYTHYMAVKNNIYVGRK